MKKLRFIAALTFALLIFSSTFHSAKADSAKTDFGVRIARVKSKLEHATGHKVRITIVNDPKKDACVLPDGSIMITNGFASSLESDDELAFILAHEISHVMADDRESRFVVSDVSGIKDMPANQLSEIYADINAVIYVKKAGFDPVAGFRVLKRVAPSSAATGKRLETLAGYLKSLGY